MKPITKKAGTKKVIKKIGKVESTGGKLVSDEMPVENFDYAVKKLARIKEEKKSLDKEEKKYKEIIVKILTAEGQTNSKGSIFMQSGNLRVENRIRKSVKINEENLKTLLETKGLTNRVFVPTMVFDEDKLEEVVLESLITVDELESVTDTKVSYALTLDEIKEEEEMPTIESN